MKEIIYTGKAAKPTAWYSQAIETGNTVYLAGVCGDDPKTGAIVTGNIQEEAKYALENLKAAIEASGGSLADIVKVQVYVTDIALMKDFNEIYQRYFPKDPPARIAMAIKDLNDGARLELDAVAVLE